MRALTPWRFEPPMRSLHKDIDDLFGRFFDGEPNWWGRAAGVVPAVESYVKDGKLFVRVDLPGIEPKDVELSFEGDHLVIKGERKFEREEKGEQAYREVRYGSFERTIGLPDGIDPSTVKATYKDGVLEVTMGAPKGPKVKKVPIDVH
jgi:HSP20 family protein